ncbi:hypothetical protein COCON_G00037190 [Conger conger]|uniref:Uncharacterized protein n=1 Tax=Conger conger TaxID=82655 RepID=A0A9Q1DZX0_CONCO|nr:hypothetical protein COCON_G00037190 [Conger conger]
MDTAPTPTRGLWRWDSVSLPVQEGKDPAIIKTLPTAPNPQPPGEGPGEISILRPRRPATTENEHVCRGVPGDPRYGGFAVFRGKLRAPLRVPGPPRVGKDGEERREVPSPAPPPSRRMSECEGPGRLAAERRDTRPSGFSQQTPSGKQPPLWTMDEHIVRREFAIQETVEGKDAQMMTSLRRALSRSWPSGSWGERRSKEEHTKNTPVLPTCV